jgi:predicted aspartyl protease
MRALLSLPVLWLLFWLPTLAPAEEAPGEESPPASAGAPAPPSDAVVGVLPFETSDEPNRIYLNLAPEEARPFRMFLDTGAGRSYLTPRVARELGVSVRRTKSTPYRRATRLGRDLAFYVDTRSSDTASKTGWEYGVLGGEFLDDYVVELDFPGRRVRFLDPKRYQVPKQTAAPDEAVLPIRLTGTRIVVEIELDGRGLPVLLDTGDPCTAVFSGKAARKLGIDVESLPDYGTVGTAVGPMQVRFYETDGFRFGGFEFDTMPILVAPRGWYNLGVSSDSVVGYDVLSQFVVRIDYKRRRLWLKRSADARVTFCGADYRIARRVGAFLSPLEEGYAVWGLQPEGTAAAFGLRNGDVIVRPLGERLPTAEEVLLRIEAGDELTVARREGERWSDRVLPEEAAQPETAAEPDGGVRPGDGEGSR